MMKAAKAGDGAALMALVKQHGVDIAAADLNLSLIHISEPTRPY